MARKLPEFVTDALHIWREDGATLFKLAEIEIPVTDDNRKLEAAARRRALGIEAEVAYAYCLASPVSTAWWEAWGGFDLEPEITLAAVMARRDVRERLDAFDPADNAEGLRSLDDYRDWLAAEYADRLSVADVKRGYAAWLADLPAEAQKFLIHDLRVWLAAPQHKSPKSRKRTGPRPVRT